jgi:hypothetical protein
MIRARAAAARSTSIATVNSAKAELTVRAARFAGCTPPIRCADLGPTVFTSNPPWLSPRPLTKGGAHIRLRPLRPKLREAKFGPRLDASDPRGCRRAPLPRGLYLGCIFLLVDRVGAGIEAHAPNLLLVIPAQAGTQRLEVFLRPGTGSPPARGRRLVLMRQRMFDR